MDGWQGQMKEAGRWKRRMEEGDRWWVGEVIIDHLGVKCRCCKFIV